VEFRMAGRVFVCVVFVGVMLVFVVLVRVMVMAVVFVGVMIVIVVVAMRLAALQFGRGFCYCAGRRIGEDKQVQRRLEVLEGGVDGSQIRIAFGRIFKADDIGAGGFEFHGNLRAVDCDIQKLCVSWGILKSVIGRRAYAAHVPQRP